MRSTTSYIYIIRIMFDRKNNKSGPGIILLNINNLSGVIKINSTWNMFMGSRRMLIENKFFSSHEI